jgi:hypothetical protein
MIQLPAERALRNRLNLIEKSSNRLSRFGTVRMWRNVHIESVLRSKADVIILKQRPSAGVIFQQSCIANTTPEGSHSTMLRL